MASRPLRLAPIALAALVPGVAVATGGVGDDRPAYPSTLDTRSAFLADRRVTFAAGLALRHGDRRLFSRALRDRLDLPRLSARVELARRFSVEAAWSVLWVRWTSGADADPHNPLEDGVGAGDVDLRARVAVLTGTRRTPAVLALVGVKLPNAEDRAGLGTDETDVWLGASVGGDFGTVGITGRAELGILGEPTRHAAQDDVLALGLVVRIGLRDRLSAAVEAAGRLPSPANPGEATLRLGLSGPVAPGLGLSFGPEVSWIERDLAVGARLELEVSGWPSAPPAVRRR